MDESEAKRLLEGLDRPVALEWQIFLDDDQVALKRMIHRVIATTDHFMFFLVLGGAGTGKTQVLLNLSDTFVYEDYPVFFDTSDEVAKRIVEAGLDAPPKEALPGAVHLIDDPITFEDLISAFDFALESEAKALVVAVDPFQWTERKVLIRLAALLGYIDKTNELFARLPEYLDTSEIFRGVRPEVHFLKTSYRQSQQAGEKALALSQSVFELLDPYVSEDKVRQYADLRAPLVENILQGVIHTRAGGDFEFWQDDSYEVVWRKLADVAARDDKWAWTHSLLYVEDKKTYPSSAWFSGPRWSDFSIAIPGVSTKEGFDPDSSLAQVLEVMNARVVDFTDHETIRGLEFQDVIVVIREKRWTDFQKSARGAGTKTWESMAPLHTFITRAVDNITILLKQ
jgi:hypothetical protein